MQIYDDWKPFRFRHFRFIALICILLKLMITTQGPLTPWYQDKMASSWQTPFLNDLCVESVLFWFVLHWDLLPGTQLGKSQHWLHLGNDTKMAASHYLYQWWPRLLIEIRISRLYCFQIHKYTTKKKYNTQCNAKSHNLLQLKLQLWP